jgi:hypothetical protein
MMKLKILNQIINVDKSNVMLPYPYYDVNYSNNIVFISNHINLVEKVDYDLINKTILKGVIDLLSNKLGSMNSKTDIVLDWIVDNIDILKDCYIINEEGKKEKYKRK